MQLLRDLRRSVKNGFDLSELFDWRGQDLDRLRERAPHGRCKPRIKLQASITAKQNLSVRWAPLGWSFNGLRGGNYTLRGDRRLDLVPVGETDWHTWHRSDWSWERPSNELLFLHEVEHARDNLESRGDYISQDDHTVAEMLLIATERRVSELVEVLERDFNIVERDRVVAHCRGEDLPVSAFFRTNEEERRLLSWEILDEDAWRQRLEEEQAAKEREELEGFEAAHGFGIETLVAAYGAAEARRKFANTKPSEQTRCKRAADALKSQGHAATPSLVAGTIALLRRWRRGVVA